MLSINSQVFLAAGVLLAALGLTGCISGGGEPVTTPPTTASTAASIILSSSATSLKADGSNSTTITATVVDAKNQSVSGATVVFTVKSGSGHFTTPSSGPSSSGGIVTITYSARSSSGTVNQTDHTDIILAVVDGSSPVVSEQISIPVTASSYALSLGTSLSSIKSDGSNSTTITAYVTDAIHVPISRQQVSFSAPTGLLGTSSGDSKADGTVTIPFSALATSIAADRTNRTEIVTATILGTSVTAQIPIQITGSTLTLSSTETIAQVGAAVSLTASAKDAAEAGVNGQTIRFSIDSKSTGAGTLSAATATTGSNGTTPSATLTGTAPGTVIVNADWLNAAGNSTYTASTSIAVSAVGISFAVTSPTSNPTPLTLAASQPISVSVPPSISGVAVANVRFATTMGTWSNGKEYSALAPVANAVTETLKAGGNSGTANIQIDALDSSGKVLATLNRLFALSAATGTQISLQASVSTVAPSTGGSTNSTSLTATVRDASNNTVGNAPVQFLILNDTGSGAQINPVVAYTNSNGQAVATFTAGALSTVGGLQIKAALVGTTVSDSKTINVAGTSVSVTLGKATAISSTDIGTTYTLPMSVLVVSSTGGAVSGATVTLSAFPTRYYRGGRDAKCEPVYSPAKITIAGIAEVGNKICYGVPADPVKGTPAGTASCVFPNEDVNENDILESGEDYDPIGDGRGLGSITPPHAAAGTLPPTVVTNANGVGTFNLIYLKNYANWVESRIRAKVVVNGTEFVNELKFNLTALNTDMDPVCALGASPFGL